MKILIVDDFISELKSLKSILEDHETFETTCGLSAIELANSIIPDIIIMDIIMPGIDGYSALKVLKQYEQTKNIPIVLTSRKISILDKNKASLLGAATILVKPFSKAPVLEVLKLAPIPYLNYCLEKELDSSNKKKSNFVKV